MQPWLKWAMLSDLNNHLWLEPGTTCKNAELSPPLETQISPLLPKAAVLCWGPSYAAGPGKAGSGDTRLGGASSRHAKVPGPCPGSRLQSTKQQHKRGNRCGVWGEDGRGQRPWGFPCPPAPDLALHAPPAVF